MIHSGLIPTARAVIDINRVCNARCRMCYYAHEPKHWTKSLETVQAELLAAKQRGNTSVDFTGGEPTLHPRMPEVIRFAESIGLHTCVISNGLATDKIQNILEAGCREWLLSIHGFEQRHDEILQVKGAWEQLQRTVEVLNANSCFVRVNCTMTRLNAADLPKLARHYLEAVKPRIVNFINFNPHHQWGNREEEEICRRLNEIQVRVSEAAPFLREALELLDAANLWANVRYYPFCPLRGLEHHICNNPQVMFDPYEWDYGVAPKTTDAHYQYGRRLQAGINLCEGVCRGCGIRNVCGGINRNYAGVNGESELTPYELQSDYPFQFRSDLEADIVVPAYEPGESLARLLAELSVKTVQPYNLIVVGGRRSAAINRNAGLVRSKAAYVIMCDDDISDLPYGWNRRMVDIMKENREILALSARLMTPDGKPGRNSADNYELDRAVVPVSMIPTACCIFRKTDVLFDERYLRAGWEDTDFFTQLHEKLGGQIAIANLVPVVHRNDEKNNGGAGNQENRRLYLSKWRGRLEAARPEESVQALLARGDFASAIPLLERQVAGGKVDGELLNNLGYACWQLGERGRAVDFFMQAAFLDPTNQDSLSNFFAASYETKQFDRLEQYLGLMREGNPAIGEYSYLLAQCLAEQGKQAEARQVLVELAAVDPAHPGAAELGERLATATVAL